MTDALGNDQSKLKQQGIWLAWALRARTKLSRAVCSARLLLG